MTDNVRCYGGGSTSGRSECSVSWHQSLVVYYTAYRAQDADIDGYRKRPLRNPGPAEEAQPRLSAYLLSPSMPTFTYMPVISLPDPARPRHDAQHDT